MNKFHLSSAIIFCVFCACNPNLGIPNVPVDSNNFVMGYVENKEIVATQYQDFPNMVEINGYGSLFVHKGGYYAWYEKDGGEVPKNEKEKIDADHEKFLIFAQKNGDVKSFNSFYTNLVEYEAHINICSADNFSKISIISDKDFDAKHPAGAELGDTVMFLGFSFYQFVKKDYDYYAIYKNAICNCENDDCSCQENTDEKMKEELISNVFSSYLNNPYTAVYKRVSELKVEDLSMLDAKNPWILIFPETAPKEKKHRLKITFTSDEGKSFSTEFIMNFN